MVTNENDAQSLKAMGGKTYNSDPAGWKAATQKYCGLEATVNDPKTGKQMLMYIGDAFDDKYVLVSYLLESYLARSLNNTVHQSPGSIDIMIDAFSNIHGNPNGNKNDVIKGVEWQLTGRVNTKYAADGQQKLEQHQRLLLLQRCRLLLHRNRLPLHLVVAKVRSAVTRRTVILA